MGIFEYLMGAGKELALFIVSMIPIVELRGAIPIGAACDMPWYTTFLISVIGNLLPVPFVIVLGRHILNWLKKSKPFARLAQKYEDRVMGKADKVLKYETIGLCLFVAIPIPGTGAWSGAVLASLLDMRLKRAFPVIALGVVIAGVIMTLASYGVAGAFRFLV